MNNRYEHMRPWRRQPNLKCILLNILMFIILALTIGVMIVMIVKQVKKKDYKGYKMEENTK